MAKVGGVGLALDVTAPDAASRIAAEVGKDFGGLDVVVHNAGITRDKMLRNMPPHFWDMVININLGAILNINEGLLKNGFNDRSEEHTSELQSLMRISYAVFCLKKKNNRKHIK